MRAIALAVLLPLLALPDGTASVSVSDSEALTFDEGHAYFLAMDGFGVMALATAPLADGSWAREGAPFGYVEVRVFGGLREGEIPVGTEADVSVQHWPADGPSDAGYHATSGTLTIESLSDSLATGTLSATLIRYAADGTEAEATLEATFRATPENIPSP
jgi:hypothetical protein